jgi:hypothetical protein
MKGPAILANLSLTATVASPFLEALGHVRSNTPTWVRARGAHGKTATHNPKAKPK